MLSASRLVLVLSTAIAVGGCGVSSGPRRFLFGDMETGADVDGDVTFGDVDLGARGASPNDPNNAMKDSDCDGLSDEEEFSIVWSGGNRTDPTNADTDNDGLLDGLEVGHTVSVDPDCQGFVGDSEPLSTTIPTEADSDADTLPDGIEDVSGNGKVDPFELDPNNPDCDGDGLVDGLEDKSHDGKRDPNETDPLKWDSDGDRIGDGSELKITRTDPLLVDTDKDGCWDGNEDYNQDGMVQMGETDPHNGNDCGVQNAVDIDKDGIPDAIEDANHNGKWDPGETDVNNPDTDGDKLKDGVEDKNRDGRVGLGETDPRWVDSDCDGLIDGPDQGKVLGEDQNTNGMVDKGETDPSSIDSDGDGLSDGMERGIAVNPDPNHCPNFIADADPNTTSDPLNADSDGDGVADGAEDADQNGRVDPGELDPKDPNDGQGPVAKACAKNNLKMVTFKQEGQADLQLALPTTFAEVATMKVNGAARGLIGYDAANKVAFLVYRGPAPGGGQNPTADEVTLRASVAGQGAISNPTTQTFNTWDGYQALQAFYDQAGGNDVKTQTNALANALAGNGAGALMGMGGGAGPFRLQVEIVHRSQNSVVVLIALTPIANLVEPAIFSVRDVGSGSALAQFGDANNVQCEPFKPKGGAVDFIFVVDNSGSMGSYQAALGATAMATANALNNAAVDWRIAVVTTDYDRSPVLRGFTRNINDFNGWMTQGGNNWVGISGSGLENCLSSAARAVSDLTPAPGNEVANKVRTGASIAVVILGDADDQSANSAPQYVNFFNNPNAVVGGYTNKSGGKITVHGIICPMGQNCGETQNNPQRHADVIAGTGGVRGDITGNASIPATMNAIVQSAIAGAGYRTLKPPIGASIKVAMDVVQNMGACNADDIPRSRVNGFDFDGVNRTISFFGACRPTMNSMKAAVSYRYWIDNTAKPDGTPPPCFKDQFFDPNEVDWCKGRLQCNQGLDLCECPPNCGAPAPPGKFCNMNRLVCDYLCIPDCGGQCIGYKTCDLNKCGCVCVQNASCPPGFRFSNQGGACGCVCDLNNLHCGVLYDADPKSCRCVCKPDCGGCEPGKGCNPSKCACEDGTG